MNKEIEVVVNPDGSVSIDAIGFEGKACEDATRELEKVLGETISEHRKNEYYRPGKGFVKQGA